MLMMPRERLLSVGFEVEEEVRYPRRRERRGYGQAGYEALRWSLTVMQAPGEGGPFLDGCDDGVEISSAWRGGSPSPAYSPSSAPPMRHRRWLPSLHITVLVGVPIMPDRRDLKMQTTR
jgi:hypothetical protein